MKKKGLIITLGAVVLVCAAGLIANKYLDWPVDEDNASGDIAKSTRFSRQMDSEKITNMEELLKTDSTYKNSLVVANVVMQTRAMQFGTLVDMSNEAAGKIDSYADVLKDMNEVRTMVDNVSSQLDKAVADLDAVISGEERPELAQNTINASLAYSTLQKQNDLANRFIQTTDEYLKTAEGNDNLKFVRDQWVDYQKMTAALDGDDKSAEELAKKGTLLSAEKSLSAIASLDALHQIVIYASASVMNNLNVDNSMRAVMTSESLNSMYDIICRAATETMQSAAKQKLDMSSSAVPEVLRSLVISKISNTQAELGNSARILSNAEKTLSNAEKTLSNAAKTLSNAEKTLNRSEAAFRSQASSILQCRGLFSIAQAGHVLSSFNTTLHSMSHVDAAGLRQSESIRQLGNVIEATSIGNRATVNFF
jgi:hypothetical protein